MTKVHNFSAGPCILAPEVLQKAGEAVSNFNDLNLSLLEISHRSKDFVEVMDKTQNLVKSILNVPEGYEVVFLGGGASLGFYIAALNFLKVNGKGTYINTGAWASKAIKEARLVGDVEVLASSEDRNFMYIPKDIVVPSDADYLHYTSNNTIFGTQYKSIPKTDSLLICDMSSDIFSKPVDISKYDLIYAGAQKNLGPAGSTLYIVKKEMLGKTGRTIPSMLDLNVHIGKDSMFNTPPVFPIYVNMLTLEWLQNLGGVERIAKLNDEKASTLYNEIDRNPLFRGPVDKEDRSEMNVTFVLTDDAYKERFDLLWKEANISGIKGHRSVGGYRASIYNAMPIEGVNTLVDVMKELERTA
jgi:phosphoserine aminotransferase